VKAFAAAARAGATTLNVPDTVGYTTPEEIRSLFQRLRAAVPGEHLVWSAHCHNDLGLAVANSLAAIEGGARQVECTVNGIGERAGNAALEELVMALNVRADRFPFRTGIDTTRLVPTSRLLTRITGMAVQRNKAIVGANAFAHESGIHQHGMLKHRDTYEIMRPETVGWARSQMVLGRHSGRAAVNERLGFLGFSLDEAAAERLFARFKTLAEKKKEVFDDDIIALVDDTAMRVNDIVTEVEKQLESLKRQASKARRRGCIGGGDCRRSNGWRISCPSKARSMPYCWCVLPPCLGYGARRCPHSAAIAFITRPRISRVVHLAGRVAWWPTQTCSA
jgi:isopropylmalate/homocitrate/citramalate synthase